MIPTHPPTDSDFYTPSYRQWFLHTLLLTVISIHPPTDSDFYTPSYWQWFLYTLLLTVISIHPPTDSDSYTPSYWQWFLYTLLLTVIPIYPPTDSDFYTPSSLKHISRPLLTFILIVITHVNTKWRKEIENKISLICMMQVLYEHQSFIGIKRSKFHWSDLKTEEGVWDRNILYMDK